MTSQPTVQPTTADPATVTPNGRFRGDQQKDRVWLDLYLASWREALKYGSRQEAEEWMGEVTGVMCAMIDRAYPETDEA